MKVIKSNKIILTKITKCHSWDVNIKDLEMTRKYKATKAIINKMEDDGSFVWNTTMNSIQCKHSVFLIALYSKETQTDFCT